MEAGSQREADAAKILRLEGALSEAQAQVSSRDALLKEERRKAEAATSSLAEKLLHSEGEIARLKGLLDDERAKSSELSKQHRQREKQLQEEAAERIAAMKNSISASLVEEYEQRLETAVRKVRLQYDEQLDKVKREYMDYEAMSAEREASKRIHAAEEKAELNALRAEIHRLREVHEAQVEQSLKSRYAIVSFDTSNPQQPQKEASTPANPSKLEEEVMDVLQAQLKAMQEQLNRSSVAPSSIDSTPQPFPSASMRRETMAGLHFTGIPRQPSKPPHYDYPLHFSLEMPYAPSTIEPLPTPAYYSFENSSKSRETKRVKFEEDRSPDFSAISDGGFHEGYWRMKYQ